MLVFRVSIQVSEHTVTTKGPPSLLFSTMKQMTERYDVAMVVGTRKRGTRSASSKELSPVRPNSHRLSTSSGSGPDQRKRMHSKRTCRWTHISGSLFLGICISITVAFGVVVLSMRLSPSGRDDLSWAHSALLRPPGLVYPETYLDNRPYDYTFSSLRPPARYRRLSLHPPPRVVQWNEPDMNGKMNDPWKFPWYGDLNEFKHMKRSVTREVKYVSHEEMLTAEGSSSEDENSWLVDVSDLDYKYYYAFDDDFERGRRVSYNGKNPVRTSEDRPPSTCRRTAQHRLMFPTCNEVHQVDYSAGTTYKSGYKFINHGDFRDVFGILHGKSAVAIKEIRYRDVEADHELYEYVRVDALVAERLAKHPQAYELYGYCGLTLVSEFFFHGDVEEQALWESNDSTEETVLPDRLLTPEQKVVLALEMAKGLALLHGNPEGMIIHGDVQMSQFLLNKNKTMLKLNDFNRAELLLWDETHNKYCQHRNGVGRGKATRHYGFSHLHSSFQHWLSPSLTCVFDLLGTWRAPEEYRNDAVSDKVDVFSLGNNMLTILTGQEPKVSSQKLDSKAFRKAIIDGMTGYIDPKYQDGTSSKAEEAMAKVIKKCFAYKPEDRPSIFEVVAELETAVKEVESDTGKTRIQFLQSI